MVFRFSGAWALGILYKSPLRARLSFPRPPFLGCPQHLPEAPGAPTPWWRRNWTHPLRRPCGCPAPLSASVQLSSFPPAGRQGSSSFSLAHRFPRNSGQCTAMRHLVTDDPNFSEADLAQVFAPAQATDSAAESLRTPGRNSWQPRTHNQNLVVLNEPTQNQVQRHKGMPSICGWSVSSPSPPACVFLGYHSFIFYGLRPGSADPIGLRFGLGLTGNSRK